MSKFDKDGYAPDYVKPSRSDVYLVKCVGGCYDFALYDIDGWHEGVTTGDDVHRWAEIPKTKL